MRIGLTTHTFTPEFIGGRERHVEGLAKVLGGEHEVLVFTGSKTNKVVREGRGEYVLYRMPMFEFPVSTNPIQKYRIIPKLYSTLAGEKLDVIHAHEYRHFNSDVSALYSRKTKTPLILTVHGYQVTNPVGRLVVGLYDKLAGGFSVGRASRIICVSGIQKKEMLSLHGRRIEEKIAVIPNGVFTDEFKNIRPNPELLEEYGLENEKMILSVGRLLYRKGFHDLINASEFILSENPDAKIVIIGPDHGEQKNLEAMIKDKKLGGKITLLGPASNDVVNHFLSACDVFVIPSLYEGLPTTLLEAMACGKPIVGSSIPSIREVITDGFDGLLAPPASPRGLAGKINQLLDDRKLSKKVGGNARKTVQKYDWHKIADETQRIYDQAVEETG